MKLINISLWCTLFLLASCGEKNETAENHQESDEAHTEESAETHSEGVEEAMLSQQQYDALNMKIDTLGTRLMTGFVEANGRLEVPPQNEATVTPVIGGNVININVIEGDVVKKGSVLASIEHPDIIKMQTDYMNVFNQLHFQEKEFQRQKKLYEAGVGSGATFQSAEAAYTSMKGQVSGMEAQLRQLNVNPEAVKKGNIQRQIPILSPIEGAIQEVNVKTGQFVQAQTNMFEIINTHHIHAELMVFEKDVAKLEVGQKIYLTVKSLPGKDLTAEVLSIGKNFKRDSKTLHVHAEIENQPENLVPGMYVRARIAVDDNRSIALPESAIAKDEDKFIAFTAEEEGDAWSFKPVQVLPGTQENEWITVSFLSELPASTRFAFNNAYYLMAEMKKGEGGGHHH